MEKEKICEKHILSTQEASEHFHIGINKLRHMIHENKTADWVLWNGSHAYVKRVKFEQLIDSINAI